MNQTESITTAPKMKLADRCRRRAGLHGDFLEYHGVLPLESSDSAVLVATWLDEVELRVLDDLRLIYNADPVLERNDEGKIRDTIRRCTLPSRFLRKMSARIHQRP